MSYGIAVQIPETPIGEEWAWLTDIATSYDGTETRIPLLRYPRRTFSGNFRFDNKDDLRRHLAMMTKRYKGEFRFPLFQYKTKLKAKLAAGDTVAFVNARRSDFRVGGRAVVMDGSKFEEVVVAAFDEESVEFTLPLVNSFGVRAFVCPVVTVFSNTNASVTRQNPDHSASSSFTYSERMPTTPFVSPLNETVLTTFDGMPILPFAPIGSNFDGAVSTGLQVIEYDGIDDLVSPWKNAKWGHNLSFKVSHLNADYNLDLSKSFPVITQGQPNYPPANTLYPGFFKLGPLPTNVDLVAGNADGTGFCRPDDFMLFNGVQFGVTPGFEYPAGTVLYTLPAGSTVVLTIKNTNDPFSGVTGGLFVKTTPGWDWWQAFAEAIQGSANAFLFPTNREDLKLVTPAVDGGAAITVKGDEYTQHYWGNDAFRRIFIDTDAGRHFAKVTAISAIAGNDRLTFAPPLPAGAAWTQNQKVGFLLKVRNDNDKIKCNHYGLWTEVSLAVRTIE